MAKCNNFIIINASIWRRLVSAGGIVARWRINRRGKSTNNELIGGGELASWRLEKVVNLAAAYMYGIYRLAYVVARAGAGLSCRHAARFFRCARRGARRLFSAYVP